MSVIVEPGRTFLDNSGRVLNSGTVTFYVAGQTVTKISIFATAAHQAAGTPAISNPQTLSSAGRLTTQVHAAGPCRMIVKDSLGATILDEDNVVTTDYTGMTATTIGTLLYPRTAAEIAASVTPTYYYYAPGDIRRYGAVSAATNVTTAFASAALVAATHENFIPPGTWNISSVTYTDGARVRTAGFSTVIAQIAGYDGSPNSQARIVNLAGSDIVFAQEGVKIVGQIATDSGEQNHAVFVYKTGASIDNITIGDVYGQDLRGDVLYIGAPSGFTTQNWKAGRITGKNVLRNVVSIVGASFGHLDAAVQDGACGLCVLDIEPDNDPSGDVTVDYVKGRYVGILPPLAADFGDRIRIGVMDLDPAYGGNTTPAYASHVGDVGLGLRNLRHAYIGNARIRNFTGFAIFHTFNTGELADQRIHFGHLEISGCGASEVIYNSPCFVANMTHVRVDSGVISLQSPTTDYAFYGDPTLTKTKFDIGHLTCDGTVVRYARESRFKSIVINSVTDVNAFRDLVNCIVDASSITLGRLLNNGTNVTFRNVTATCATSYLSGTIADVNFDNCSGGLEPVATPAQITANQNDYVVGQMVTDLRLSTDASRNVTGITNGRKGRQMRVYNVGSFDLVLVNESASSTAANRLALGADLTMNAGEGATLWYDSTSSRWRCASRV